MVIVCDNEYPNEKHLQEFKKYNFELDHFQKYAIEHYNNNNHVLVTAHTGSGKTLPAEYAIQTAFKNGKKSIYTAPIKSLSNQKFNEFTEKYPEISFGILTGDIKFNPEADCLIMTTEILRNTLFQKQMKDIDVNQLVHFNMDIENELECVIFDEVHYINDESRGKVWEESIMMIPKHVKLVMLSATINNIEGFAKWIENTTKRDVAICSTTKRVVPLTHYGFLSYPKSFFKDMNNEEIAKVNNYLNEPILLKQQNSSFRDKNLVELKKIHKNALMKNIYTKPSFVLKNAVQYLEKENLLPAICFVFSRRNVEKYAKDLNMNLSENSAEIENMCLSILKKLPNYKEYQQTKEYETMIQLLKRGVAIHHSGIMPILREMVELLFSKGFIKILFATETFAVGVNMPAKTVIFTNLHKFTGNDFRKLHSHEYTQMAGRAGRRGLDSIGVVIHLMGLFNEIPFDYDYKSILSGTSQQLVSKFKIHSNLVMRIISNNSSIEDFITSSMITNEINREIEYTVESIKKDEDSIKLQRENLKLKNEVEIYHNMLIKLEMLKNKQRKKFINQLEIYKQQHPKLCDEYEKYKKIMEFEYKIYYDKSNVENIKNYISRTLRVIIENLKENEFVKEEIDKDNNKQFSLTLNGQIASNIQEVHSLAMSRLIMDNLLTPLSSSELASYLSIFTQIRVTDEHKLFTSNSIQNNYIKNAVKKTEEYYDYFYKQTTDNYLDIVDDYKLNFDIVEQVFHWCEATNEIECKIVIESIKEKGIFVGEFVKAIIKINNIVSEIEKVCNIINNMELLQNLSQIKNMTMKYIISSQSLYL